jgi:hypothetical protein
MFSIFSGVITVALCFFKFKTSVELSFGITFEIAGVNISPSTYS